jgi:hypothetical protein
VTRVDLRVDRVVGSLAGNPEREHQQQRNDDCGDNPWHCEPAHSASKRIAATPASIQPAAGAQSHSMRGRRRFRFTSSPPPQ